jgi:hypothetical protein
MTSAGLDARIDYIPESDSYLKKPVKSGASSFIYSSHSTGKAKSSESRKTKTSAQDTSNLVILDITDAITLLESEVRRSDTNVSDTQQSLNNITQSVDKFAKYLKSIEFSEHQGPIIFVLHSFSDDVI